MNIYRELIEFQKTDNYKQQIQKVISVIQDYQRLGIPDATIFTATCNNLWDILLAFCKQYDRGGE